MPEKGPEEGIRIHRIAKPTMSASGFDFCGWRLNDSATKDQIEGLQRWLGANIPQDFKALLLRFNGGEGPIGNLDLRILGTAEVIGFDSDYEISKRLGTHVLPIGTDGGDQCIVYDLRDSAHIQILSIPLGALDFEEGRYLGDSLKFVISAMACGAITSKDV